MHSNNFYNQYRHQTPNPINKMKIVILSLLFLFLMRVDSYSYSYQKSICEKRRISLSSPLNAVSEVVSGIILYIVQYKMLKITNPIFLIVSNFEEKLNVAGDSLVVIDYSTTWCGPCKMVLPKYIELSERYLNVVFLKCIGDSSVEASALLKREGVRSVPAFHFWYVFSYPYGILGNSIFLLICHRKNGKRIDTVNGARIEDVEIAVKANL